MDIINPLEIIKLKNESNVPFIFEVLDPIEIEPLKKYIDTKKLSFGINYLLMKTEYMGMNVIYEEKESCDKIVDLIVNLIRLNYDYEIENKSLEIKYINHLNKIRLHSFNFEFTEKDYKYIRGELEKIEF